MWTTEIPVSSIALSAAGGISIGTLYFASLWWTVRRISTARHPVLLVGGTLLLRGLAAAAGIVFVSGGLPLALAAAVAGFLLGRTILIRVVGAPLLRVGAAAGQNPAGPPAGRKSP